MKFARLCSVMGLAGCVCFGQDFCGVPKLGASADASAALERISDVVGFVRGRILLFTSSDPIVGSKGGAMSLVCASGNGEERWIVYDPRLIKDDLARDFTLAHETAHQLNDDPRAPGQWSKQQELDADEFGSEYLTRLGWNRDKLLQAFDSLGLPKTSISGYPTLDERRAAVIKGFEEESARRGSTGRGPEPSKPPLTGPRVGDTRVNSADGLTYVYIPPGMFVMGCSQGDSDCRPDERPPRNVTIPSGLWLGQTEVTQAVWAKVMGRNPSRFRGDQLPVDSVSWDQASAYCRKIGGRLPKEEEWEYAARAGTTGARYGSLDAVAWYFANSGGTTHPVGLKQPNAFGLYDILGNVSEWTSTDITGGWKVKRGGSFDYSATFVSSTLREGGPPAGALDGLRCVWEFR